MARGALRSLVRLYRAVVPERIRSKVGPIVRLYAGRVFNRKGMRRVQGPDYIVYFRTDDQSGTDHFAQFLSGGELFHEPFQVSLFLNAIQACPNCVVVDVGASYGLYTLEVCAAYDREHLPLVIAIEPSEDIFLCLEKSIQENGFADRVMSLNAAATDTHNRSLQFFRHAVYSEWSKLVDLGEPCSSVATVRGVSIDRLLQECGIGLDSNFVLKIDVEGGEPPVFRGLSETLTASRRYAVFFEFHPPVLQLSNHDPKQFARQVMDLGADNVFEIDEERRELRLISDLADFEAIISRCLESKEWWRRFTNILACRNMSVTVPKSDHK